MATDSTELTFVRCPACRSLVPAVSTRCRMCGATLDASLGSESSQPPASGRVRQKTMTTSGSNELAEHVSRVREEAIEETPVVMEETTPIHAEAAEVSTQVAAVQPSVDPLSGYIEDELVDVDLDDDDSMDSAPEVEEEVYVAPVQEEPEPVPTPEPIIASAEESLEKAKEVLSSMGAPEPKKEEQRPRVVVEQGKGRFNKGGLSFGSKGSDASQRRFDIPKEEVKAKSPEVRREEPKREEPKAPERQETRTKAPERENRKSRESHDEVIETPPARERPAPSAAPVKRDTTKHSEVSGRLFGWLVNYNEPNGTSIELREGRFFVSSTQLRPTDLVLDDSTISTPHAMFTVGLDTGIVIQDLKSERGVFIRERDASTYRREYDSATLEHGDWIRFGDLEFLVSIIAHVGVK